MIPVYTFTTNGSLQQQKTKQKCRSFVLFVENNKYKTFRRVKGLDCRIFFFFFFFFFFFRKKINPK